MNQRNQKRDYFGFLPNKWTIEFDGGEILPSPEFEKAAAWVDKYTNEDGFLYPPTVGRAEVDPITMKPLKYIPKTDRPAHLHRIPASHEICLSGFGTPENIREGPGSFIIQLLAYLFRARLQFYDWWVDGRIPITRKTRIHNISFDESTAEHFLSHCYKTWKSWAEKEQKLITNLLFMHTRSPSYEWEWERFIIEYMVFDACYKLEKSLGVVKETPPHGERVKILCRTFQVPIDRNLVQQIVQLRNGLFHETLWDGSQPGGAVSSHSFILPDHLRRLNQRLIMTLLGYKTPYIQTGWWFFGNYSFDRP